MPGNFDDVGFDTCNLFSFSGTLTGQDWSLGYFFLLFKSSRNIKKKKNPFFPNYWE